MEAWIPSSCQTLLNLNNSLMNRNITKKVRRNITEQPRINKNKCERLDYCLFDFSLVWNFQSKLDLSARELCILPFCRQNRPEEMQQHAEKWKDPIFQRVFLHRCRFWIHHYRKIWEKGVLWIAMCLCKEVYVALNYYALCVVFKMLFHRSGNHGEKSLYIAT